MRHCADMLVRTVFFFLPMRRMPVESLFHELKKYKKERSLLDVGFLPLELGYVVKSSYLCRLIRPKK